MQPLQVNGFPAHCLVLWLLKRLQLFWSVTEVSDFSLHYSSHRQDESIAIVQQANSSQRRLYVPPILLSASAEFQHSYSQQPNIEPQLQNILADDPRIKRSPWYCPDFPPLELNQSKTFISSVSVLHATFFEGSDVQQSKRLKVKVPPRSRHGTSVNPKIGRRKSANRSSTSGEDISKCERCQRLQ